MKKSVNGLTFDEVFEERGKKVEVEEMVKGNAYLTNAGFGKWNWLFIFTGLKDDGYLGCDDALPSDGEYEDYSGAFTPNGRFFYEATPNQIELLNAYKNAPEV